MAGPGRPDDEVITVLFADDDEDMRILVKAVLDGHPGAALVAEAEDGLAAYARWSDVRPDVLVLDQRMPGLSGLEAAERVRSERPEQVIVLFTAFLDAEAIEKADQLGVVTVDKRDVQQLPAVILEAMG